MPFYSLKHLRLTKTYMGFVIETQSPSVKPKNYDIIRPLKQASPKKSDHTFQ